jgi:hypothetical protein
MNKLKWEWVKDWTIEECIGQATSDEMALMVYKMTEGELLSNRNLLIKRLKQISKSNWEKQIEKLCFDGDIAGTTVDLVERSEVVSFIRQVEREARISELKLCLECPDNFELKELIKLRLKMFEFKSNG